MERKKKSPDLRSIRSTLARAKSKFEWNQADFATNMTLKGYAGFSDGSVSNWTRRGMPAEKLEAVSEVLECSMDELIGRPVPGTPQPADPWPFPEDVFPKAIYDRLTPNEKILLAGEMRDEAEKRIARRDDRDKQATVA